MTLNKRYIMQVAALSSIAALAGYASDVHAVGNLAPGVIVVPGVTVSPDSVRAQAQTAADQAAAPATVTIGNPTPPAAPARPFFASLFMPDNNALSAGAPQGELAITNIVLTNFASSPQQVYIFAPVFAAGAKCGDRIMGGSNPHMQVYVQPAQTLVIPYPTPLVVKGLHPNCIAAEVTTSLNGGSVEMDVNGFLQG